MCGVGLPSGGGGAEGSAAVADGAHKRGRSSGGDLEMPKRPVLREDGRTAEDTALQWRVRGRGRAAAGAAAAGVKRPSRWKGLDPVVPLTDPALLGPVASFYGIGTTDGASAFPLATHLISRSIDAAERPRRCYYVSDACRHVLMMDEAEALKITAAGLKARSCRHGHLAVCRHGRPALECACNWKWLRCFSACAADRLMALTQRARRCRQPG